MTGNFPQTELQTTPIDVAQVWSVPGMEDGSGANRVRPGGWENDGGSYLRRFQERK